jgi:hypothetical protein
MENDPDYITDEETTSGSAQGYTDGSNVRGAASLKPREMSKAIGGNKGRRFSQRYTNMLNAASRDAGESLFLKVRELVEQLGLDPTVKEAVNEKAEALAARMRKNGGSDVKENEVALAACIRVMQGCGWSLRRIAERLAKADRKILAVEDLRVGVIILPKGKMVPNGNRSSGNAGLSVRVGGEERRVEVLNNGVAFTKLLRVPVFATDDGKLIEFAGASIWTREERSSKLVCSSCRKPTMTVSESGEMACSKCGGTVWEREAAGSKVLCPSEPRRLEVLDAHRAVVKIGDSFESLKLIKRVELRSEHSPLSPERPADKGVRQEEARLLLRRYSTEELPLTEYLANSVGALMQLRAKFAERFVERFDPANIKERLKNHQDADEGPLLRSPRLLAHEALYQADEEVFAALPKHKQLTVARLAMERGVGERDRKRAGTVGFLVESELKAWEEP